MKILVGIVFAWCVLYCDAQVVAVHESAPPNKELRSATKNDASGCSDAVCPIGTVRCSTRSGANSDFTQWIRTVDCIDFHGNVLNSTETLNKLAPLQPGNGTNGYYNDGASSSSTSTSSCSNGVCTSSSSSSSGAGDGSSSSSSSSSSGSSG